MASLLRAYNSVLQRRPYAASMATSAVLFGGGDVIAQQAIEKKGLKAHDWARTARLTFYGGVFFGPAMTKWYQLLNRIQFPNPTKATIYRVALDQGVLTPGVVAFFFSSMTLMEGKGFGDVKERLDKAYQPTLLRNWCVFVPTQIINFALVPHHLRFVVVSVVSLFWSAYWAPQRPSTFISAKFTEAIA
ncbi:hypothetical protein FIBSPDRAFT_1039477 [Athelia psychrophila]|uniref:Uncharacterized protein n=1 Tax=Athelia psychrophila TaxID=1759441 RepID=A0A166RWW8_9AGAM|nr:hypothetical protein FIBSPDRAFT_1039477 [Fibularhizoctonia sp. CBS 109695]